MSIPVEYSFHEDAPSQHEIDLRHTDALTMADSVMTFRLVVKEVAAARACTPRSCPSRSRACRAAGMHIHLSLFRGDENAFYDDDDPHNLSPVAKSFMAGLLRHAAEITAITNQTVNSYKRLVPGFEAPVHISWARNNRSGLIRVPIPKRGNPTRDPHRVPLARSRRATRTWRSAVHARRRHARHRRGLRAAAGGRRQPVRDGRRGRSPSSASTSCRSRSPTRCSVMERSELVHEALGEHIFEWFLRNKRSEWRDYKTHVSAVRARSLPEGALMTRRRTARRLPRPAAARPGAHARPRRLPLEGRRRRPTTPPTDEPAGGWAGAIVDVRRTTPRARGRCAARCASATRPSRRCCVLVERRPARRSRAARRAVRRLLPHAVPPDRVRGPPAAPALARRRRRRGPTWSSTASSRSTSRPTRRRSRVGRST